ncbi:TLC domain-containing protein [Podospora conica]|nr:TLC domain-containing protein [Schizothecium conicum]
MRDPFPFAPIPALSQAVKPWADRFGFYALPLHIHEVLAAALFYTFIHLVVSPIVSTWWFPSYYPRHSRSKKVNWDAHVVSIVQSTFINLLALYVMWNDDERREMDWQQRIWGYDGACSLVQSMAAGYFLWDFVTTLCFLDVFGLGLLAHASSALTVYIFGFRPFLHYYSPVFILYELSTPFLNMHWFFDKVGMTGTRAQLYNGLVLLFTFASCRLVWGTYQSATVYGDMWRALHATPDAGYIAAAKNATALAALDPSVNNMAFVTEATTLPAWLAGTYLLANVTLNSLNWFWFVKMIAAVRKRFEPAPKEEKVAVAVPAAGEKVIATGAEGKTAVPRHRRQASIEDVMPDSEELRHGTIQ